MEHTTISIDDANRIITSVQSEAVSASCGELLHSNDYMKPMLEAGADGIMIPMVNTTAEADTILHHLKFSAEGAPQFWGEPRPWLWL